jgi:hypothetical protein
MIILFLILGAIGLTAAVLIATSLLREEGIEIWQPDCPKYEGTKRSTYYDLYVVKGFTDEWHE